MTAIDKVKKRLWMSDYKVVDVTSLRFINAYDLVVEGIYRVAVRTLKERDFYPHKVDVVALVEKSKITFYKDPSYSEDGEIIGEVVDTSPVKIFIKHERKHTNSVLRRKAARPAKSRRRN